MIHALIYSIIYLTSRKTYPYVYILVNNVIVTSSYIKSGALSLISK